MDFQASYDARNILLSKFMNFKFEKNRKKQFLHYILILFSEII